MSLISPAAFEKNIHGGSMLFSCSLRTIKDDAEVKLQWWSAYWRRDTLQAPRAGAPVLQGHL